MRRTLHDVAWRDIHQQRIRALTEHNAALEQVLIEAVRLLAPLAEHDVAIREWLGRLAIVRQAPPTNIAVLTPKAPT